MEGVEFMTYAAVNDCSFPLMLLDLKYSFVIIGQLKWLQGLQQTWKL